MVGYSDGRSWPKLPPSRSRDTVSAQVPMRLGLPPSHAGEAPRVFLELPPSLSFCEDPWMFGVLSPRVYTRQLRFKQ